MREILVVIGSRANYGSIKSCLKSINEHNDLKLDGMSVAQLEEVWQKIK